jgi:hypothetical protein
MKNLNMQLLIFLIIGLVNLLAFLCLLGVSLPAAFAAPSFVPDQNYPSDMAGTFSGLRH